MIRKKIPVFLNCLTVHLAYSLHNIDAHVTAHKLPIPYRCLQGST